MTPLFHSEREASGLGALVGCTLALVLFLFSSALIFREFTQPSFTAHQLAQLKADCELQQSSC